MYGQLNVRILNLLHQAEPSLKASVCRVVQSPEFPVPSQCGEPRRVSFNVLFHTAVSFFCSGT